MISRHTLLLCGLSLLLLFAIALLSQLHRNRSTTTVALERPPSSGETLDSGRKETFQTTDNPRALSEDTSGHHRALEQGHSVDPRTTLPKPNPSAHDKYQPDNEATKANDPSQGPGEDAGFRQIVSTGTLTVVLTKLSVDGTDHDTSGVMARMDAIQLISFSDVRAGRRDPFRLFGSDGQRNTSLIVTTTDPTGKRTTFDWRAADGQLFRMNGKRLAIRMTSIPLAINDCGFPANATLGERYTSQDLEASHVSKDHAAARIAAIDPNTISDIDCVARALSANRNDQYTSHISSRDLVPILSPMGTVPVELRPSQPYVDRCFASYCPGVFSNIDALSLEETDVRCERAEDASGAMNAWTTEFSIPVKVPPTRVLWAYIGGLGLMSETAEQSAQCTIRNSRLLDSPNPEVRIRGTLNVAPRFVRRVNIEGSYSMGFEVIIDVFTPQRQSLTVAITVESSFQIALDTTVKAPLAHLGGIAPEQVIFR